MSWKDRYSDRGLTVGEVDKDLMRRAKDATAAGKYEEAADHLSHRSDGLSRAAADEVIRDVKRGRR